MQLTVLVSSLLFASSALARGAPKPKKTLTENALSVCGCDIPLRFFQECQKIPKDVSNKNSTIVKECLCSSQWYGWPDSCSDCLANAENAARYKEQIKWAGEMVSVAKQIYVGCSQPGGSVSSDGNMVCGHTFPGDNCAHVAEDGKSGWVSFAGKGKWASDQTNVTGTFNLGEFKPSYEGQKLELPKSGYPGPAEKAKLEAEEKAKKEKEEKEKADKEKGTAPAASTSDKTAPAQDGAAVKPNTSGAASNAINAGAAVLLALSVALAL